MTAMPALRDILNDTPANAIDVDFNFQTIEAHIDGEMINRDGTVAMTAPLDLQGPAPSAPTHAARMTDVEAVIPVGTIWQYAGTVAPTGWAFCDGSEHSSTDPEWVDLFAVIGTTYGAGAGDNFRLPDLRGRFPVGVQSSQAIWNVPGEVGGNRDAVVPTHNHTASQPAHNHTMGAHVHGMDHDHGSVESTMDGHHAHTPLLGSGWTFFSRQAGTGTTQLTVAGGSEQWNDSNTTAGTGNHTHDVNLPNYTGNTQAMESASPTGSATPAITVNNAGVSATDKNLPPYIALNFMIRL